MARNTVAEEDLHATRHVRRGIMVNYQTQVHPSVPACSVHELLALASSRPGALNYASAGVGTNPHIAGELFNYLGKVNIVAVHFKGADRA